jgi:hypothetical protein
MNKAPSSQQRQRKADVHLPAKRRGVTSTFPSGGAGIWADTYFAGHLFFNRKVFRRSADAVAVDHLMRFGLSDASRMVRDDPAFARKLLLLLYRKLVGGANGDRYVDLHRLARFFAGNPDKVRFDELGRRDLWSDDTAFRCRICHYVDLHRDLVILLDEFAKLGVDWPRAAIVARGIDWGKLLLLKLIQAQSRLSRDRVRRLGRWCITNAVKINLDWVEERVVEDTGAFIGWVRGDRWEALLGQWRAEYERPEGDDCPQCVPWDAPEPGEASPTPEERRSAAAKLKWEREIAAHTITADHLDEEDGDYEENEEDD